MDVFTEAVVVVAVAAVVLMMWTVGALFRRVGPNRALIVYGWGRHPHRDRRRASCLAAVPEFSRVVVGIDVVRRRARAGALHLSGCGRGGRGGIADQSQVGSREHPHRRRAIPDQAT